MKTYSFEEIKKKQAEYLKKEREEKPKRDQWWREKRKQMKNNKKESWKKLKKLLKENEGRFFSWYDIWLEFDDLSSFDIIDYDILMSLIDIFTFGLIKRVRWWHSYITYANFWDMRKKR